MALARSSYPIVLPLCKGPPVSERPSPWLPSRNGLLGQLGLACRDRVGDRRAGLVAAPLLGGVEFFELGRVGDSLHRGDHLIGRLFQLGGQLVLRSEEHTSELQSLMRISYAVFCLKK